MVQTTWPLNVWPSQPTLILERAVTVPNRVPCPVDPRLTNVTMAVSGPVACHTPCPEPVKTTPGAIGGVTTGCSAVTTASSVPKVANLRVGDPAASKNVSCQEPTKTCLSIIDVLSRAPVGHVRPSASRLTGTLVRMETKGTAQCISRPSSER